MELTEEPEPEEPDYDDDSSDDFMEEDGGRTSAAKENLQNILFGAGRAFQNLKRNRKRKRIRTGNGNNLELYRLLIVG